MRTGACSALLPSHTLSSGLSGGAERSQSWKWGYEKKEDSVNKMGLGVGDGK